MMNPPLAFILTDTWLFAGMGKAFVANISWPPPSAMRV